MGAKWTPEGLLTQEQAGEEVVETNISDMRSQQDGEAMGTGPIRSWSKQLANSTTRRDE